MPSKDGLQKSLRAYVLFFITGLCITMLLWGAVRAQLNTRAISFDENAPRIHLALGTQDNPQLQIGSSRWQLRPDTVALCKRVLPGATMLLPAPLHCLWEAGVSCASLLRTLF